MTRRTVNRLDQLVTDAEADLVRYRSALEFVQKAANLLAVPPMQSMAVDPETMYALRLIVKVLSADTNTREQLYASAIALAKREAGGETV